MRFHYNLYVGNSIKHPELTKWRLRVAAGQFKVYVIVISDNGSNQLEIFHNALLKQSAYHRKDLLVVGIAGDYSEAVSLVTQITEECVISTGTANIKDFLLMK